MQDTGKRTHLYLSKNIRYAFIVVVGCLLGAGSSWSLRAQSVHVSVWSSAVDHSLESDLVFQSQTREEAQAVIHVYEDILAQQIGHIGIEAAPDAPEAGRAVEAPPSMDQEAQTLIVDPLKTGAVDITSASGANMDFLLITQLSVAVKPMAYRLAAEITGSHDIESLAFRNPDGTHVLFTVNHSESPVSLEASWSDRLFTYTQAEKSVALFAWNPKSQLVSLIVKKEHPLAGDTLSLEAKCSQVSPLGIHLRCESPTAFCSIFPVYFTCDSQQNSIPSVVTVLPSDKNVRPGSKPVSVTITAAPDVGESSVLVESHLRIQ